MKWSNFTSFLVILTFNINPAEGLKWISEPLVAYDCKRHTVNFTWEYMEEPGEEITQLQWIYNGTEIIAYSSLNQGFNVEPKYQGRVNQSGKAGILLHNISAKDSGNYTLYPVVKWKEIRNLQTVQLNVIVLSQRCVPNLVSESTTQSKVVNQEIDSNGNKELMNILHRQSDIMISVLVIVTLGFCVIVVMMCAYMTHPWKKIKNQKKRSTGKTVSDSDDPQEFQSLRA